MDAPQLAGKKLPDEVLRSLYHDAAWDLLEPLHSINGPAAAGPGAPA